MLPVSQSLPVLKTSRSLPRHLQPALLRRFRRLLSRSSPEAVCTAGPSRSLVPMLASFPVPCTFFKRTTLSRMASWIHSHRAWMCLVFPTPVGEHIPIAAVESVSTRQQDNNSVQKAGQLESLSTYYKKSAHRFWRENSSPERDGTLQCSAGPEWYGMPWYLR